MILQTLPPFLNVVASGVATLKVPKYNMTLTRLQLTLGGTTFTKAMVTDIKLKLGTRMVYNTTGSRLDAMNSYKGMNSTAYDLVIDFTERDAPNVIAKELGGYDLSVLDDLTIEVTISGATAPTLSATAFLTPPQGNPLIMKLLYVPAAAAAAGKFPVNLIPNGALIKRVWFFYGGTDWTSSADGNLNRLEVKKNGLVVWDATDMRARFIQGDYKKTPQSKLHVYDPIVDNNQSGALVTSDARSLEFNTFLTAADTLNCYLELIDLPNNA